MHEMSVALEVCRIAEEHVGPDAVGRVVTVGLEVGDDAGVEISSLAFCLEATLAAPPFRGAKPEITRLPGDVLRVSYLELEDRDDSHD
jgi:Zn finger protein HypA/HybF involved in hydrogenase expression